MIYRHLPVTFAVMLALTGTAGFLRAISGDSRPEVAEWSPTDRQFVTRAAQAAEADMTLAKLAQLKSQNPRVKALATTIHRDHESALDRLKALAEKRDVKLPALSVAQQAAHDRLASASADVFDQQWVAQIAKDLNETMTLFTLATRSTDADLRSFAQLQLPARQAHLKTARELIKY